MNDKATIFSAEVTKVTAGTYSEPCTTDLGVPLSDEKNNTTGDNPGCIACRDGFTAH
jgi:hypothetical protein